VEIITRAYGNVQVGRRIKIITNNIDTQDSIYGPSIIIVRLHLVHVMNVDNYQAAAYPQTKPTDLVRESACRLLLSTPTITI